MTSGSYSKFIVAMAGIIATYINQYYATAHWATIALATLTAVVVYLVPNGVSNVAASTTAAPGILPGEQHVYTSK
jgi:hypothetical protein